MSKQIFEQIADGRTDLIFELMKRGYSPKSLDDQGVSLIKWCSYYGDVSGIRHLLLQGESLESLGINFDLEGVAFHGHWQLCQFLVEQGADPNFRNAVTGETPLHAALCKANRPDYDSVVDVLLNNKADPNVVTEQGKETGAFMRDSRTKGETPLHRAAAFGTENAIKLLLNAGAKVDVRDMHGDSPLSWASWHLRPDSILRLLCYDNFKIHPNRQSTYDHGRGWGVMGKGKPHASIPFS